MTLRVANGHIFHNNCAFCYVNMFNPLPCNDMRVSEYFEHDYE